MASLTRDKINQYLDNGLIEINPLEPKHIECNSYDYRLDYTFRSTHELNAHFPLDTREDVSMSLQEIPKEGIVLLPGTLYLMSTFESFRLADNVEAFVDGRSTLARYGISTHLTAGNIKPGFCGKITLEVTCVVPVKVYPHMKFGQIMFSHTDGPPAVYSGRYQNQETAQSPFSLLLEGE